MSRGFEACHDVTARWEGGHVDHPQDPGGETIYGISKRAYPNVDIASLTYAEAKAIYRKDYWKPVRGDSWPAGMDLVVYDASVNSGTRRGPKWMQAALGVAVDGKVGPKTIKAAKSHPNKVIVIQNACRRRLSFMQGLRTWRTFGRGWSRRVADIEARAASWAVAEAGGKVRSVLIGTSAVADARARRAAQASQGTAATTGAGGALSAAQNLPTAVLLAVLVVGLIGVLWLWRRNRIERDRQSAYIRVAQEVSP